MRISDWSSDVCSSDLALRLAPRLASEARISIEEERGVPRQGYVHQQHPPEAVTEAATARTNSKGAQSCRPAPARASAKIHTFFEASTFDPSGGPRHQDHI